MLIIAYVEAANDSSPVFSLLWSMTYVILFLKKTPK